MTVTSNGVTAEIQKLYDSAVAAESLKGLFVGIYEYGKAVQKQGNWNTISATISKFEDAGSKDFTELVSNTWRYVDQTIADLEEMDIPYRARDYLSHAIGYRAEKDVFDPESDHLELACGSLEWFERCDVPKLKAIGKEASTKKKEYQDAVYLFERTRETPAWYAWNKIEEFIEAYEGDHRLKEKCKGIKSTLIIATPWEIHASDLKTIMNDRWETETLFAFQREPYKAYLTRFHRWFLETFPQVVQEAPSARPAAAGVPVSYERSEQGYKLVIKVGEVQVALQQGTKKSKFLETLMDANSDEVTYEQMAEDLNETKTGNHAKLQLWRKYDQQYYGINNSFAGKGIVGFLSKTSKGFKVSETYKRRGA